MRLYDLTTPEHRLITSRSSSCRAAQARRLAHKVADEVVLQFTGEPGIADTKIAYVRGPRGAKEIVIADYDGAGRSPVTRNGSINLSPVWSPDARSLAFTSYKQGYPDLYRAFPFERRPDADAGGVLAASTARPPSAPTARSLAMTLSKDGNPRSTC